MALPANSRRTFSEFDLQRIREMLENGLSQAEIARAYSVHSSTISRLIARYGLHVAAKPLTPLERYIAVSVQLRRLYDDMEPAYRDGDTEELARIDAEIAQLKDRSTERGMK
jgi:IS30 family transposase